MLTAIATLTIMSIIGSYIMTRKKTHDFNVEALIDQFDGKISNVLKTLCMAPFLEECVITLAIPMILRDLGLYHDYLICALFGSGHLVNSFFINNRFDLGFQVVNTTLMRYVIIGHHFYACVFLHYYFNMMGVAWVLFWTYVIPVKNEEEDKIGLDLGQCQFIDYIYLPERSRSVGDADDEDYDLFNTKRQKTTNHEVVEIRRELSQQLANVEAKRVKTMSTDIESSLQVVDTDSSDEE